MLHYVILFLFLVIIVTLNPNVAFSPNAISNVTYNMYCIMICLVISMNRSRQMSICLENSLM